MLTAPQLKTIFENKYDRFKWIKVLRENFGITDVKSNPKPDKLKNNLLADEYFEIGSLTTKDDRVIGIYEVNVKDKVKIERNKVGLRDLLKQMYKNDVDAAFVIFDQKKKWRFSYVSEVMVRNKETGKREERKTDPKRYTYLMGEGERCKTAADRFTKLKTTTDLFGEGVTLKAIEDAFSVEKLSRSFFDEYRKHYGEFTKFLTGKDENNKVVGTAHAFLKSVFNGNEKGARDFIKKLLGRIVFLYFLEKKGWLGVPEDKTWGHGDENFLSNLFKDCKEKESFYPAVLVPLYFNTLNNENRTNDLFKIDAALFTKQGYNKLKIPYLNGGLFDDDEKHTDNLVFPPNLFTSLFDFFDQYNFTVYEDSPDEHTIAVDPEMLGHIFENLLEDNKDKGAYYTPKEIVHYMCRESLIEYLYTKLNPQQTETYQELGKPQTNMFGNAAKKGQLGLEQKHNAVKETVSRQAIEKLVLHNEAADIIEHDEAILKALKEVKICDPAIGSGAFPMGLLMEIFHLVEILYLASPDVTADIWKLKGKDWESNRAAVKMNIIENSIYGVDIEKGAVDIARLRFWLSLVVDEDIPKPLPNLDYKIVVGDSLLSKFENEVIDIDWNIKTKNASAIEKIINDQQAKLVLLHTRQREYFQAGIDKVKQQLRIRDLKIDILINQITLSRIQFDEDNKIQKSAFPTDKDRKRTEEITNKIRDFNRSIHKLDAIKNNKNAGLNFFDWKLDFPEVMNERVAKDNVGFDIVIANPPYKILTKNNTDLSELKLYLTEFNSIKISSSKNIFTLFIEKAIPIGSENAVISYIVPEGLYKTRSYIGCIDEMEQYGNTSKIVTFTNYVFENAVTGSLIFLYQKNKQKRIPVKFHFNKNYELVTIKEAHDIVIDKISSVDYPMLSDVSDLFKGMVVKDRSDMINETHGKNIFLLGKSISKWLIQKKFYTNYSKLEIIGGTKKKSRHDIFPRILIRRTGNSLCCAYLEEPALTESTLYSCWSITDEIHNLYLFGLLNSKLLDYYIRKKLITNEQAFPQILMTDLETLPIAKATEQLQKKIISNTLKIISAKAINIIQFEKEINLIVYKLYQLTYEEASIVEGNTEWMSKVEYENFKID